MMIWMNTNLLAWMLLVFLFCFCLGGCASSWKKIDENLIPEISKGDTTKSDILFMFGEPNTKEHYSGNEIWSYKYLSGSLIAGLETKIINIYFRDNSVREYVFVE